MRGGSLGGGLRLAVLAAASLGAAAGAAATATRGLGNALVGLAPTRREHHMGRTRYPLGYRPGRSIADQPHEHKRAIARRLRQAERNAERQRERYLAQFHPSRRDAAPENVGQSRRGGLVFL